VLSPNATVMSWRGEEGGREAVRQGHDAIMVPNNYFYFDYYQTEDTSGEPLAIGGCVTVPHVYSYNPRPAGLTPEEQAHILGVQANVWTEYMPNFRHVEYMVLPRMAALSEVQWSDPTKKDYEEFSHRLRRLMHTYDSEGYNYARHIFNVRTVYTPKPATGEVEVTLQVPEGCTARYTLDGSVPTATSTLYTGPFYIGSDCTLTAVSFLPDGTITRPVSQDFTFNKATNRAITLLTPTHSNYTYGGAPTLVDGIRGNGNIRTGRYLGFNGNDLEAIIDLGAENTLSELAVRTFVDRDDWVFNARGVKLLLSADGETYTEVASEEYPEATVDSPSGIITHTLSFEPATARYAKVIVGCEKVLPEWHGGTPAPAFLFVDEISLR
ncbi:MAG: family 20 glycosylhydrolase, partial [Muribaculaceae bacterium]|nr:family 20 glycosylhydrolase [Muribaculaceae bacterium]